MSAFMSGRKTACQNNLWQKRTTCGKKLLVGSEQFSGQDGTLCRNTFHVRMEHFVEILFMSGWNTLSTTLCQLEFTMGGRGSGVGGCRLAVVNVTGCHSLLRHSMDRHSMLRLPLP